MLRGKVDPKKEEQERLQGFLLDMLKEEENKYCADCQAKTPRYVFLLITHLNIEFQLGSLELGCVHLHPMRRYTQKSWCPHLKGAVGELGLLDA